MEIQLFISYVVKLLLLLIFTLVQQPENIEENAHIKPTATTQIIQIISPIFINLLGKMELSTTGI